MALPFSDGWPVSSATPSSGAPRPAIGAPERPLRNKPRVATPTHDYRDADLGVCHTPRPPGRRSGPVRDAGNPGREARRPSGDAIGLRGQPRQPSSDATRRERHAGGRPPKTILPTCDTTSRGGDTNKHATRRRPTECDANEPSMQRKSSECVMTVSAMQHNAEEGDAAERAGVSQLRAGVTHHRAGVAHAEAGVTPAEKGVTLARESVALSEEGVTPGDAGVPPAPRFVFPTWRFVSPTPRFAWWARSGVAPPVTGETRTGHGERPLSVPAFRENGGVTRQADAVFPEGVAPTQPAGILGDSRRWRRGRPAATREKTGPPSPRESIVAPYSSGGAPATSWTTTSRCPVCGKRSKKTTLSTWKPCASWRRSRARVAGWQET